MTTKFAALAAPSLILFYGIMRFIDGLDGDRGNGPAWYIGHTAFFVAFVLMAVLAVRLRRLVPAAAAWQRVVRDIALGAALVGAAAFLWVTFTDLVPAVDVDLPEVAQAVLPMLFVLGMLTLMSLLASDRRVPWWSPAALLVGFVAISANLDTLPFAAAVLLCGLAPLASTRALRPGRP